MPRTTLFLFLSLSTFFTFSQVNIVNRSFTDSTLNIVYIGVENAIELVGLKNTKDTILFSTTNGMMRKHRQNQYVLNSLNEGECTLTFSVKGKNIAQKTFKADPISAPIVRFGSHWDSIDKKNNVYFISFNNLIKDPTLRFETTNFYSKQQWKISSYRITLDGGAFNRTTATEFVVTGVEPTTEQVQKIKDFGGNTFMVIDEIRVIDPDGRNRRLIPLIINIK